MVAATRRRDIATDRLSRRPDIVVQGKSVDVALCATESTADFYSEAPRFAERNVYTGHRFRMDFNAQLARSELNVGRFPIEMPARGLL